MATDQQLDIRIHGAPQTQSPVHGGIIPPHGGVGAGHTGPIHGSANLFVPASMSSLVGWYDADRQTDTNGASVTTFTDQSGKGNHFTGGASKPTMSVNAINGRRALAFASGSTQQMTCATGLMNGATAGAFFAVVKQNNNPPLAGGGGATLTNFTSTAGSDSHHPFTDGNIYDGFGIVTRQTCGIPGQNLANVSLLGAIAGPADYRFLINNTTFFSSGAQTVAFGTQTRYLGFSPSAAIPFAGLIAEVIILNAVPSAADIANTVGYINRKYGTAF
jgi:hypothetical protein